MKTKNTQKNFIWNMFGIGIYAITSLIFMIIVTRINGMDDAGIFTFGFSFACMIQIVGTYGGRTYQVTDISKETKDCDYLYLRVINCFTMLLISLIFIAFKDYSIYKISIILLLVVYKMIFAYSDTIFGIFQKNDNLYQVGISLALRSVLSMLAFFVVDLITSDMLASTVSLMLCELMVFVFYDCLILRNYSIKFEKLNKGAIKLLLVGGFSVFIFMLLSFVLTNVPKFAIDDVLSESDQAVFGIIQMPATLIAICANFIVQPFINDIKKFIKDKKFDLYKKLVFKISFWVSLIGVFVLVATYFIGIPLLNLIYGIDLSDKLCALLIIVFGSIFNGLNSVISNALIAIRKNTSQVVIYAIGTLFIFIMSYSLVIVLGVLGTSLAYCLTNILLFLMYVGVFLYYVKKLT